VQVTVRTYLFLRKALGGKELTLELPEGSDINGLLAILRREYELPDRIGAERGSLVFFDGDEIIGLLVLVNGRSIKQLQGKETVLPAGAVVTLFPPAAGG